MYQLKSGTVKNSLTAMANSKDGSILVIAKGVKDGVTKGSVVFESYDAYYDWYSSLGTLFSSKTDNGSKAIERLLK